MTEEPLTILELEFIQHYVDNAKHIMWFLGAGASRSAGLPTATDITWDLKRRYYCLQENQNLQSHDINNKAVRHKIQTYMDSKGYPANGLAEEYSFYFELTFGENYSAQQKYIAEVLSAEKISLNVGHRILAGLVAMGLARIVFTTNFDEVIERAYSEVSGKNLSTFHLEGAYAAIEALNADRFPIYCKVHGDFRYQKLKNLSVDLQHNDLEIRKCFLAAATRYGLVVSGYSGRDENVMTMMREAVDQNNAFPHGLFWTVPHLQDAPQNVLEFMEYAEGKGIQACLVETGTFDELLSKIWRQVDGKPKTLDERIRRHLLNPAFIPLPKAGRGYPILRTNGLPIIKLPSSCGAIEMRKQVTMSDLRKRATDGSPRAFVTYQNKVLFWGDEGEMVKLLSEHERGPIEAFEISDIAGGIEGSSLLKSFYEKSLARALCFSKPLLLRLWKRTYFAVVRDDAIESDSLSELKGAIPANNSASVALTGTVPGLKDVTWAEAVSISLVERNGSLWLMLKPDIWIRPLKRRSEARDFLRQHNIRRYNNTAYRLLDAWIGVLLGRVGTGSSVNISFSPGSKYQAEFEVGTRTAYSMRDSYGK